jgi:hypothetical protein
MRKILVSTALLLAVSTVPALAQDTLVSRGDVAKATATFEGLITAMTKTQATIDELLKKQMIEDSALIIVDAKPLLEGKGSEMLKIQQDRNKDAVKELQKVLEKHPAVLTRLKKESAEPDIDEILAAEFLADGKLRVYYMKD